MSRNPNEPELTQYWPGESKSGFIESIFLEDKDSGGTVKISLFPEPPSHDIEELDSESETDNSGTNNDDNKITTTTTNCIILPNNANSTENPTVNNVQLQGNIESVNTGNPPESTNTNKRKAIGSEEEGSPKTLKFVENDSGTSYKCKLFPQIEYSRLLVEYLKK